MEREQRFEQQLSFDQEVHRPRRVDDFTGIASNGRLIYPGESRRSKPVPGTSDRKHRNSGQRNR